MLRKCIYASGADMNMKRQFCPNLIQNIRTNIIYMKSMHPSFIYCLSHEIIEMQANACIGRCMSMIYWWISIEGEHRIIVHCLLVCLLEYVADGRAQWHIKNAKCCMAIGHVGASAIATKQNAKVPKEKRAPTFDIGFLRETKMPYRKYETICEHPLTRPLSCK